MRLFIAINFTAETRMGLLSLRDELISRSIRGNFCLPENLHLTLAFIGEVSPKKLDKIKTILDTVEFAPFDATIEQLGAFSHGTLWYAGLREDKPLMLLQREIEHKLALCGFEMGGRMSGGRMKGPSKRTTEQDRMYERTLKELLGGNRDV